MTCRLRLLLALLAIVLIGGAVLVWWPRPGITVASAARVKAGMTRGEVEAILGGPPRNESTVMTRFDTVGKAEGMEQPTREQFITEWRRAANAPGGGVWHSDDVILWAFFDDDGGVCRCCFGFTRRRDSLFNGLRRMFRLR